jgi:hypothetical protein
MTWGAGAIDNKMEVCPLSSEVHPSVHFTMLHSHAWALCLHFVPTPPIPTAMEL